MITYKLIIFSSLQNISTSKKLNTTQKQETKSDFDSDCVTRVKTLLTTINIVFYRSNVLNEIKQK